MPTWLTLTSDEKTRHAARPKNERSVSRPKMQDERLAKCVASGTEAESACNEEENGLEQRREGRFASNPHPLERASGVQARKHDSDSAECPNIGKPDEIEWERNQ